MTKTDLEKLQARIRKFRDDRDWKRFHNPKDLAISICIEASELLEEFQWKGKADVEKKIKDEKHKIEDEMADVYIYLLELSDILDVDLIAAANKKMTKNELKYPVQKSKGSSKKYTEL